MPLTHSSYLLKEMEWLAADVAQVSATCEHRGCQAAAFPQGAAFTCMPRRWQSSMGRAQHGHGPQHDTRKGRAMMSCLRLCN